MGRGAGAAQEDEAYGIQLMKLETKCRRRAVEALLGMTFDMSSAPEIEQAMDRDEGAVERVTVDMGTGEILAVEPAGELPAPATWITQKSEH